MSEHTPVYDPAIPDRHRGHSVQTLSVIMLLFLFAVSGLTLIALGAGVYQNNVSVTEQTASTRTAYAYLTEKVRQADAYDGIRVGAFPGNHTGDVSDTLILSKEIRDDIYETCLYVYDGNLMELTMRAGSDFRPESGTAVFPAKELRITEDPRFPALISVTIQTGSSEDARTQTLFLYPRSFKGGTS